MTSTRRRLLCATALALAAICAAAVGPSDASALTRQGELDVKVFLVAAGDNGAHGKRIGCDDSLVPVTRHVRADGAPIAAAVRALLAESGEMAGTLELTNFWVGTDLALESATIEDGTATIRILGQIDVTGACDGPRIKEQVEATARQFPGVAQVRVFVGGRPLSELVQ